MSRQRLSVFDLDSTLTLKDTYLDYLIGYLARRPLRLSRTIGLPVDTLKFKLGMRNNSWLKQRFLHAILGGVSRPEIDRYSDEFVDRLMLKGMRANMLQRLREVIAEERVILVTASFEFYVERLAEQLGIDEVISTRAEWVDDCLSGKLAGANCYGVEKLRRLDSQLGEQRAEWDIAVYTDHHSDCDLLQWADRPVAVHPTNKLRETAVREGFEIIG